jgi:tripartite-type tricarboxylate transporter receptor subunit TctC
MVSGTRLSAVCALALATTIPCIGLVSAQSWPARPMTMVVTFAAGSSDDVLARIISPRLSELLGQQVVIENIGGAGGMNGVNRVAKAQPDGYQFVIGGIGTFAANQTLYKNPLYNAATDFAPVVLIAEQAEVLTVRKDLPANNLQEFIAYAKTNQAKMQYGTAGAGSSSHLACLMLNAAIGVATTHVPYRSSALAMQDMVAGRIDYTCPIISTAAPQIEGNQVKAIANMSKSGTPLLPKLASLHEQGLADFDAYYWNGVFLPKGTAPAIVRRLHEATIATMETPVVQERLRDIGAVVVAPERRSPEYLARFVASEIEKWAVPIRASGISIE